jgi:hypothetical protein
MNTGQNPSAQQIISAVQTMPLDELEKLVGNVLAVRAFRHALRMPIARRLRIRHKNK